MLALNFQNKSDFDLKIACLGPLLVEIWSDLGLILRFLGLIFFLATLQCIKYILVMCSAYNTLFCAVLTIHCSVQCIHYIVLCSA